MPRPNGKLFVAADDSPFDVATRHRVYAAFRNLDGSFTPETLLSDTTNHARRPAASVDSNGDVHVVFYQSINAQEFAAVPGYAKYTAATGEWSCTTIRGEKGMWARLDGGRSLHARWPSSHEAGIREYRVAWGTARVWTISCPGPSRP